MRESVINLAADARPIYGPYTGRRKALRFRGPTRRARTGRCLLPSQDGSERHTDEWTLSWTAGGDSRLNRVRKQVTVTACYHFDGIVNPRIHHAPTLNETLMAQLSAASLHRRTVPILLSCVVLRTAGLNKVDIPGKRPQPCN